MPDETCCYCYKPAVKFKQTLSRWNDGKTDKVAHHECYLAVAWKCPQCESISGVKIPNGLPIYCEDCGWPDEDFNDL